MEEGAKAISLHQPWASLLVHGIKRIEGRSWPTDFRGTLWIHATTQVPSEQIVRVGLPIYVASSIYASEYARCVRQKTDTLSIVYLSLSLHWGEFWATNSEGMMINEEFSIGDRE